MWGLYTSVFEYTCVNYVFLVVLQGILEKNDTESKYRKDVCYEVCVRACVHDGACVCTYIHIIP